MLKIDLKKRRLEDKVGPTQSIVAPSTKFKGSINGPDSVRISGQFEGDIYIERLVRLAKGGSIDGTIRAPYVIIEGELNGNIESAERVEIRSDARMVGNVNSAKIAIAEGSYFQGEIKMPRKEDEPIIFVEKRKIEEQQDNNEV